MELRNNKKKVIEIEKQEIKKIIEIIENISDIAPDSDAGNEIVDLCKKAIEVIDKVDLKLPVIKNISNDNYPLEKAKRILRETFEQGKNDGFREGKIIGDENGFDRGYKKGLNDMRKLKEL